jgi:hypothetical protein
MDRPLGPRQPDKRLTAYESIFGRPSVNTSAQSSPTTQYPYPSSNTQHYTSTSTHPYLSQQLSPRQSFYAPTPPQSQSWSYPNYSYHQPYPQSSLSPVPNNNNHLYAPQPDDQTDPNFDSFSRQAVVPPQAYQAQAYHNSPAPQQQGPWGPRPPPPQPQQPAYEYERYQNGAANRSIPHLGVNIDVDNGRLGLDFDEESSPSDTDDSELPWANSHSCMYHSMRILGPQLITPFSRQSTSPLLLSTSRTNTCPPPPVHTATTISPRFTLHSLHRFRLFRCFRPSF